MAHHYIHTNTRTLTHTQWGQNIGAVQIWTENIPQVRYPDILGPPLGGTTTTGIRYELSSTTPPEERLRVTALVLNVTLTWAGGLPAPTEAWVAIQNLAAPAVFSTANLPPAIWGPAGNLLAGTDWLLAGYDDGTGWDSAVSPASISIPLGVAIQDVVNGTTMYDLSTFCWTLESYQSGRLNIDLQVATGLGITMDVSDESLTVTELDFFTGIDEHGVEMGRPLRDMKTGLPAHAPDLVEDGYRPGIWTAPDQWDPTDPRDEQPVRFPSNEGSWDDDVPAD